MEELGYTGGCAGVQSAHCACATRYFGDRFCLNGTMHDTLENSPAPKLRHDVLRDVVLEWWRGGRTCSGACHSGDTRIVPGSRMVPRALLPL